MHKYKREGLNYHQDYWYNPPKSYQVLDLLQIGKAHMKPGAVWPMHTHVGFFELTCVISGSGNVNANNVWSEVSPGDIIVSFPYDTHSIEADANAGMNYIFFSFFPKNEEINRELSRTVATYPKGAERKVKSETVISLINSAIAELDGDNILKESYLESIFTGIIVGIIRKLNKENIHPQKIGKREELCFQISDYINTHIYSIRTLSEIADRIGYDYSYISKIYSEGTGERISDYYRFQRLEVARVLIGEGELSITEIAEKLGYSSIYSFSKAFKKMYGDAPRIYKNQNK